MKNILIGTKFCHLGDKIKKTGRITIASYLNDLNGIRYGVSYCSPKDTFIKSLGCTIASNRLIDSDNIVKLNENNITHKEIMLAIICDIIDHKNYPDWAHEIILDHIDWYCLKINDIPNEDLDLLQIDEWLDSVPGVDLNTLQEILSGYLEGLENEY